MQYLLMRTGFTLQSRSILFISLSALPSCFNSMITAEPKSAVSDVS